MKFQVPRGTRDILPPDSERWAEIEERARTIMECYGYREVRTPIFESTELFVRGVGEATDIVRKELYTFEDRKGRSLTLRPEGTAPLVRAYVERAELRRENPARLSYLGPMFRYERPQAGRYRQFWQIGAELLGAKEPAADVEMIDLFVSVMCAVGLPDVKVRINSLGDAACRPVYRERLRDYFARRVDRLCGDDRERLETNPLRILDCKVPDCQPVIRDAPTVLDALCDPCREHLDAVVRGLKDLGLEVETAPRLVRGLDYYTRTVFEVHAAGLGAQSAVGGGGRYDQLVQDLGGPDTPAIGFSIGMDRLYLVTAGVRPPASVAPDAYVVARRPEAAVEALWAARALRGVLEETGAPFLRILADVQGRSASAQMKVASRLGAAFVVFVPAEADGYAIRDMIEGKDEMKQPDLEGIRSWLRARRAAAEVR